jgi:DeoR/GlpR family transcriptional regulator of sugar metabolism
MLREERLWHVTQKLKRDRVVVSSQLAEEFGLTAATVRSDLAELERRGIARRSHGGAVLMGANQVPQIGVTQSPETLYLDEPRLVERFGVQHAEKEAIGRAAAALVADGETIMIDGGTTTYEVIRVLGNKRNLTVISNVLNNLWQELSGKADLQIFLTGGFLRAQSLSLVGEVAEIALHGFRANKAILGIDGISIEHGFTTLNFLEASVKKHMIEASQELIIVADHTKFGKVGLIPVAQVDGECTIVTDWRAPVGYVTALKEHGVRVIMAAAPAGDTSQE